MVRVSVGIVFWVAAICLPLILAFTCGSNRFENWLAKLAITLDCGSRLSRFNSCCMAHDRCYDAQAGKAICDNIFCGCVDRAAKGTVRCGTDAGVFCSIVKNFGDQAYKNARKQIFQ
ncbi:hypothetical protein FO519_006481 [Halicephalobus sp. NKZ332]|nr:hypothetical protein FO519_006481 [Halicephalobus sp. NKZ332]